MKSPALILCIDGLDPSYLEAAKTPHLDRLGKSGTRAIVRSVIPTVTNVNCVSLLTGSFPETHGITSNYYYDPRTGEETFMESSSFLRAPTLLERAEALGLSTALVTSKAKLCRLLSRGPGIAFSAQSPPPEMVEAVGPREDIYSPDVDLWMLRAVRHILKKRRPAVLFAATTDYIPHHYPPESPEAQAYLSALDAELGRLQEEDPERRLFITADHGMREKREAVDLDRILARQGIPARTIPIIRDEHIVHHKNLSGACYVFLMRPESAKEAARCLLETPGVESVFPRAEAASRFRLMAERIGDLFVLGDEGTVFGPLPAERQEVRLRSHGSAHEALVPLITSAPLKEPCPHHLDVARGIFDELT